MPESQRIFDKSASTIEEQIALLRDRGLVIVNEDIARHYLTYIGYYHLSGYMLHFQHADRSDEHHQFHAGTSLEDIIDLYSFDRKLRLLIMDAVERIEIALKSAMINEMSIPYGPHWYMERGHFIDGFKFDEFMQSIHKDIDHGKDRDKIRNMSIRHYYETYSQPTMPPLWMIFEALSFGTVSLMFNFLPHADQKRIADHFGVGVAILKSWLHATTIVRNICAHHARVWNRIYTFKPKVPKGMEQDFNPNILFYAQAVMLNILVRRVSPETRWPQKLKALMDEHPAVPIAKMGFSKGWHGKEIWQ